MKIVVIRGTGLIGSKTFAILRQGGHEIVAAYRADSAGSWFSERYECVHERDRPTARGPCSDA
jgi:NAD dependent epimerase/dehydratase family enzyme